ncbi:MAG: flagellar motor protein MotB [Bryobacterales bacterium]|nr:flagellar motor protein MotB [Bryobacterales bacterium]
MTRRKKPPQPENHERWLVSYADFITLLFAFFVVMFASSQSDRRKAQQVSVSVRKALEEGPVNGMISRFLKTGPKPHVAEPAPPLRTDLAKPTGPPELMDSLVQLSNSLKNEIEAGEVEVRLDPRGLIISLKQRKFFPSGTDAIEPSTLPMLETIARELRSLPNAIRMEGHTDSVPIRTARFRSNWDLSSARAIAVLNLFRAEFQLPMTRMAVGGYAETSPVAPNDTEEGRARNRRVDIVVLNDKGRTAEPQQAPSVANTASSGG